MGVIDRETLLSKVARAVQRVESADKPSIDLFTESLDDSELRTLVKLLGAMIRKHDRSSGDGALNLVFFLSKISEVQEHDVAHLVMQYFCDTPNDYPLKSLWPLLPTVLECEDRSLDAVRAKAHLEMLKYYEPIDMSDPWTYEKSGLASFINKHPEDVELVLWLRKERNISEITDDLLAEFKASHSSISDGLL